MAELEDIKSLSQLMATFNFLQGKKNTYGQIERFLKKHWQTGPMMIISRSLEINKHDNRPPSERVRMSWNKRCYGGHYSKELLDQVFERVYFENEPQGKFSINGKDYFLFDCGDNGKQLYFGFFELKREVSEDSLRFFNLFNLNIGKGWAKLDELKKVEDLIYVDDVTGLYNQRKLLKDIEIAVKRYEELKEVFTILFIDIDHFKSVNDGHGHIVGTQLLASLGDLLKTTLRESDLIYRYGGDEFVMLIPDVDGDTGKVIGHRVLNAVKNNVFKIPIKDVNGDDVSEFNLTVSIGVATFPKDASCKAEILSIADKMMYEAKKGGRGRVCCTSEILND